MIDFHGICNCAGKDYNHGCPVHETGIYWSNAGHWRPIETAPKDGTVILLFEPDEFGGAMATGKWVTPDVGADYWGDGLDLSLLMDCPTHWMPLPIPPDAVSSES